MHRRRRRRRGNGSQRRHPVRPGRLQAPHQALAYLQPERARPGQLSLPRRHLLGEAVQRLPDRHARLLAVHDDSQREHSLVDNRRIDNQPHQHYRRTIPEGRPSGLEQEMAAQVDGLLGDGVRLDRRVRRQRRSDISHERGERRRLPLGSFLEEPRGRAGVRHLVLHLVLRRGSVDLRLLLRAHPGHYPSPGHGHDQVLQRQTEPAEPDAGERHQDDGHRQCVLRHHLDPAGHLLPVDNDQLGPVAARHRLLRPDFAGVSVHLYQSVYLRHQVRPGEAHSAASLSVPNELRLTATTRARRPEQHFNASCPEMSQPDQTSWS